ncbi:soluble lytic murein transglycosylase-like protein [Rhizobium mesoamericanum]|uniref:lytic transglycosylase domain-containing protein n=1 Tax=Rhizobium mesoamericanum TaxID=1079800 RepID=UPI002788844B|nr:lytic transglycosylase domain-containing protein [Rhizobium mesoamericanum]MDQ0561376.1 soluble lytic murein transglycosylase-like protein [Rhizobium mesoamericanum]
MVAIGFSGLKRSLIVSTMLCGVVAGCTSVEYTSQAELTAAQTVVPTPRPGEDATLAAVPAGEGATQTAMITVADPTAAALTAPAMPAGDPSQLSGQVQATTATGNAQIPLTPEMTAIQSVVPIPRPGTPSPSTQLAFAATPQAGSAIAALSAIDTTPHPMMDYGFDTSGPSDPPAAPPMFSDSDDDGAPTVEKSAITKIIDKYSKLYQVPASLLHRVVHRESRYNAKAYNKRGYFGLMQIKYNTAKSMGYEGEPAGLFDAETNIKYAAKYLRGAWLVSDNSEDDAVRLYARGYYYDAKRKGMENVANGSY